MRYLWSGLVLPLLLVGKTGAYYLALRLRRMNGSALTCLTIAGAPLAFGILPIPLPFPFGMVVGIGIATFVMMKLAGVPFFPDGVLIPLAIELLTFLVLWGIGKI